MLSNNDTRGKRTDNKNLWTRRRVKLRNITHSGRAAEYKAIAR
jgi:hypothetical protein